LFYKYVRWFETFSFPFLVVDDKERIMTNQNNSKTVFAQAACLGRVMLWKNKGFEKMIELLLQGMAQAEEEMMRSLVTPEDNGMVKKLIELIIDRKGVFALGDELGFDLRSAQEETGFNAWVIKFYPAIRRLLDQEPEIKELFSAYFIDQKKPEWMEPAEEPVEEMLDEQIFVH
jgi:hypothetical protein